jgi:hypothetical protein
MPLITTVTLKPLVCFREFPFGTADDPSMRESMADLPQPDQDKLLDYLRSGLVLGVTMGADLTDWFDRPTKANPIIEDRVVGGTTEMTDGVWFWHAGLIYFVEKYNVRLPDEFTRHAARSGWRVDKGAIRDVRYECSLVAGADQHEGRPVER